MPDPDPRTADERHRPSDADAKVAALLDAMYDAYLSGDPDGMADLLAVDAEVRFLGQPVIVGREAAREFFAGNDELFRELHFTILDRIIDGTTAAVTWSEVGITASGESWSNHGVDVFHVRDQQIVSLHENNDVVASRRHFG